MRSLDGRWAVALTVSVMVIVCLELGLRLLPGESTFDRWLGACEQAGGRSPLNHEPTPGRRSGQLGPGYGRFAGFEYEETYDEYGIKRSQLRPQDGQGIRILFLGDSFIEGYDDADTVPQRAYEWIVAHGPLPWPVIVLNAGYSSYSPVIFTVQAKRLLPIVRPDFVVADIDESDLFDDAVRYRRLVRRDADGRVVAVDRDPERLALVEGCTRARSYSLRLRRLVAAAYYQLRLAVVAWRLRESEA